jgi:outer membrane protein assembly factor BamB
MGNLFCLDAQSGKVLWSHDYQTEYHARIPTWGSAGHPLLDGDKLFCIVGGDGSVAVAFDKNTGKELWRALSAREPGYCPPTMIQAGGTKQLIIWHPQAVNALDPETGKTFWSHPWEIRSGLCIPTPRQSGDLLFLTSFYSSAKCFRLNGSQPDAKIAWEGKSFSERNTDTLHSLMCTPFIDNGYIYGICSYGQLRCLNLNSGERIWESLAATGGKAERWGNAFIVAHEDRYFLFNEHGELIIAQLSPDGYQEVSRTKLIEPTNMMAQRPVVWTHPAFANKCVYVRNDKEIVCASLAEK